MVASNTLSQPWTGLSLYAYHPILLLERTLVKIRADQVEEGIVITPCWSRRSLYLLLQLACVIPILLPRRQDLLSQHLPEKGVLYHTDLETLQLTVWKLSGATSRTRSFLM